LKNVSHEKYKNPDGASGGCAYACEANTKPRMLIAVAEKKQIRERGESG
jgi:hypothetical protein